MSQVEELKRNFCPHCTVKVPDESISCNLCGSEDLIPDPYPEVGDEWKKREFDEPITGIETAIEHEHEEQVRRYIGEVLGREETDVGVPFQPEKLAGSFLTPEEEDLIIGAIPLQALPEPPKIQLDENAVKALTEEKFGFLTGNAGTGKTTLISEVSRINPKLITICATTGIAAVNLNSRTVHSELKFFDLKSMENAWREQLLHKNLRLVRARTSNLLIDEASMLGAEQLDLIMNAVDEINSDGTGKQLGVWLSGDLCQLPPVNMRYVFKSDYWYPFQENTIKLTKVWRQDNVKFMEGVNLVRANKGIEAMEVFKSCGVNFVNKVDDNFEGTTLIPNNNDVDAYNEKRLRMVQAPIIRSPAKISGKSLPEWQRLIPVELRLKVGAYVMILANNTPDFDYVNGDCGWVEDYLENDDVFKVKLKRNGNIVRIPRIKRQNFQANEPEKYLFTPKFTPYIDFKTGDWVVGEISYHPLRLAYASTIHKSQGLSLDMVQINTTPPFFGYDSMGYVSISRARTPEGLFLVGKPEFIGRKITMNKEVMQYV